MTGGSSSEESQPPGVAGRLSPSDDAAASGRLGGELVVAGCAEVDSTIAELEKEADRLRLAASELRRVEAAALARAAAAGDGVAWSDLIDRFDRMLRVIARSYRLSSHDIDDVVQATWVKLYVHIGRIRHLEAIGAWLATTLRRESLNLIRTRALERLSDQMDLLPDTELNEPEAEAFVAERRSQLAHALADLSERQSDSLAARHGAVASHYEQVSAKLEAALTISPGREISRPGDTASGARYLDPSDVTRDVAGELLDELESLFGPRELDSRALERAARVVAAEQSWRDGLGVLLDDYDVARLLGVDESAVAQRAMREDMIVLAAPGGSARFPAFQFQDGRATPALARAHRTLVTMGHVSPWSAASWARTRHPELESRSPAQWTGEHRDEETLLVVAERDAARAAQ